MPLRIVIQCGMNEYLKILGQKVSDCVTGAEGVATSVSFDLYGCVQVVVQPERDKDGKMPEPAWFDHKRLKVLSDVPVMAQPAFDNIPGGQALPQKPSQPIR